MNNTSYCGLPWAKQSCFRSLQLHKLKRMTATGFPNIQIGKAKDLKDQCKHEAGQLYE